MAFFRYADGVIFCGGRTKGEPGGDAAMFLECGDNLVAGLALSKDNIDFLIESLQEFRDHVPDTIKDDFESRKIIASHKGAAKDTINDRRKETA